MTNVLYIHGYASHYDPNSPKMLTLGKHCNLFGVNVEYPEGYNEVRDKIVREIIRNKIDILVGTSMGGYMAQRIGGEIDIPWVAINPAIKPKDSLRKRGHTKVSEQFTDASFQGRGLVLLDLGDEIIDSSETIRVVPNHIQVVSFPGGNHRFHHMEESIPHLNKFINQSMISHGLSN